MNWRKWMFDQLKNSADVIDLCPQGSIYGGGSLTGPPSSKPFIVITISDEVPSVGDAVQHIGTVWAHDEPGDYGRIGQMLSAIRAALPYQVADEGGIACVWQGNSGDLANDIYSTITRNASFNLLGREL